MAARLFRSAVAVGVLSVAACNGELKEECGKFLAAMKPLDQGTPSAETVDRVVSEVGAIQFQDQPLGCSRRTTVPSEKFVGNEI